MRWSIRGLVYSGNLATCTLKRVEQDGWSKMGRARVGGDWIPDVEVCIATTPHSKIV